MREPHTLPLCISVHWALVAGRESVHNATMTLKNAAALALIGALLLTVLLAVDFLQTVLGILADAIPAVELLRSLVYLFASLGLTVFFYVFHKAQSR
jgi:hypothetical protein